MKKRNGKVILALCGMLWMSAGSVWAADLKLNTDTLSKIKNEYKDDIWIGTADELFIGLGNDSFTFADIKNCIKRYGMEYSRDVNEVTDGFSIKNLYIGADVINEKDAIMSSEYDWYNNPDDNSISIEEFEKIEEQVLEKIRLNKYTNFEVQFTYEYYDEITNSWKEYPDAKSNADAIVERIAAVNGSANGSSASGSGESAVWLHNNSGWWYQNPDGTYPTNGWLTIDNKWYCFDASGYMRTGWIQGSNGAWYYCDTREGSNYGAMLTDTRTPDGFYVDADGVWIQDR